MTFAESRYSRAASKITTGSGSWHQWASKIGLLPLFVSAEPETELEALLRSLLSRNIKFFKANKSEDFWSYWFPRKSIKPKIYRT